MEHRKLIELCEASYCDNIQYFLHETGLRVEQVKAYFGDSLHKFYIDMGDVYVIVFRGSVNKFDWINDFSFDAVDYGHTNVHTGFMADLNSEIKPILQFDKPVIVTGHSLGGALALLEAYRLTHFHVDVKKIVLFGNPMVGAKSFQEYCDRSGISHRTTRYVNGDDIVPSLAPLRYYQVGNLVRIGHVRSWFNLMKYYHMIHDHHCEEYVKEINKFEY